MCENLITDRSCKVLRGTKTAILRWTIKIWISLSNYLTIEPQTSYLPTFLILHIFSFFIHKTSLRNLKNKQVSGQVWKLQCKYLKIKTEALKSSESAKLKGLLTKALSLLSLSPGLALGAIC